MSGNSLHCRIRFDAPDLSNFGKSEEQRTPITQAIMDVLDVLDAAQEPHDAAFIGFRFDEWLEEGKSRYGVLITDHWLISFGWNDDHAVDLDLERID
jgi:hypothetical protein